MLFVVMLTYKVPQETIQTHLEPHLKFLDRYYANEIFMASGPQVPWIGGVILARSTNKEALQEILKEDPFWVHNLAEYHILEFVPTKYTSCLESFLKEDGAYQR